MATLRGVAATVSLQSFAFVVGTLIGGVAGACAALILAYLVL